MNSNEESYIFYIPFIICLLLTFGTALFTYYLYEELEDLIIGTLLVLILFVFFIVICGGISLCAAHDTCFERKIIEWVIHDYVEDVTSAGTT